MIKISFAFCVNRKGREKFLRIKFLLQITLNSSQEMSSNDAKKITNQ